MLFVPPSREREKLSQREEFWQQVENLARSKPEWQKLVGQMENLNIKSTYDLKNDFDQILDNCDLTYDQLEQESRDVSSFMCNSNTKTNHTISLVFASSFCLFCCHTFFSVLLFLFLFFRI